MSGISRTHLEDDMENYKDTIHAIIGFMICYFYDDAKKERNSDVLCSQGRRFQKNEDPKIVTPDVSIYMPDNTGIVGEVKKTFPHDETRWSRYFDQIRKYDDDFLNWSSDDGKVDSYKLVMLVYHDFVKRVTNFYSANKKDYAYKHDFAIVDFIRTPDRIPALSYTTAIGKLNHSIDITKKVPMHHIYPYFEVAQLYDSEPPLPYLMDLIWRHVITVLASKNTEVFTQLRKTSKMNVDTTVDDITKRLKEGFSFDNICHCDDAQPEIPRRSWVVRACDKFVQFKDAEWQGTAKERNEIRFKFKKFDDILEHCKQIYLGDGENSGQMEMFKEEEEQ